MTETMRPSTLFDRLVARIADGEWRTGDRLPSQADLMRSYGASRHAVRSALDRMAAQGLVAGRQGSGTYVQGRLIDYYVKSRTRYSDNVRKASKDTRMELLGLQTRRGGDAITRALALPRGAPVHDLHIIRWGGADPLCVAHHCFSADLYPDLPLHFASVCGISDLISRLGVADFRRSDTAISARHPSRAEAAHLRITIGSPVVVLEGRNVDPAGHPVEVSTSIWPASRIRVHV